MKKLFLSMAFVLVAGGAFAQMDAVKNATNAGHLNRQNALFLTLKALLED